jgi:hypothetical protein
MLNNIISMIDWHIISKGFKTFFIIIIATLILRSEEHNTIPGSKVDNVKLKD